MNHDQNILTQLEARLNDAKVDDGTYRPRMFRLVSPDDRNELAALFEECRNVTVHDQIETQLSALIESRHPEKTFRAGELKERAVEHLDGKRMLEYELWVYYPWSRRLVHILDEDEFIDLRTSRNRYKITQQEQDTLSCKIIGVVGLSVGQSVALTMAIERSFGEIIAAVDRLRLLHPRGHQDFVKEIRWTPEEVRRTRDGIDLATVDLTVAERAGLQLAREWPVVDRLRRWNGGKGFESLSRKSLATASAVGLIRLHDTGPHSYFEGGRVVQRVWLEAARQRLAFQPVSGLLFLLARLIGSETREPIDGISLSPEMKSELPELRERFLNVFPNPDDQMDIFLFRLSLAAPPTVRSLRRPVEDVLTIC